jgi:opacity protein-like surface antigen
VEPAAYPPEADPRRFDLGIQAGYRWLTQATESANAVFGDTGDLELGGFASFAVTKSVFLSLSGTYFEKDGQRVFVVDATSPVFELGHPLKLRLAPVNLVVGYRFHVSPSVVPYLAAGGGATFYEEETTIGGITETSSSTHGTLTVMGGVDYVNKNLLFGLQVSWSTVPDSLGVGGVSAIYGEDDVGGLSVSARLGLRF